MIESLCFPGGAEVLARRLPAALDRSRFEPLLCVVRAPFAEESEDAQRGAAAELDRAGVPLLRLRRTSRLDPRWGPLTSLLRRERIDVIHSHMFASNLWAAVLGTACRVPVVVTHEHTWSFEGRPFRKLLEREVMARGSDCVLAVSEADRRRMVEIERIPPERIRVLPNGIEAKAPSGDDARARLGVAEDAPVLVFAGRISPQKALEVLVDAVAILVAEFPALCVLIAGPGDALALRVRAAALGLDGTVRFLGGRSDVPDLLEAADVGVLSSDYEGSPLAVIEYMEAGLPTVATAVGGVPDLIEDGVHGLLVPPRDPVRFAEAVARLLRDPAARAAMGERARERRRREFDFPVMVRRVEDLYEELYERSLRQRAGRPVARWPRPRAAD
jgi:glycosyltransferase involved in cell wall biosynthesis